MEVVDMLKTLVQVVPLLAAAKIGVWAVIVVCLAWLLGKHMDCKRDIKVERAKCARDIKVASIQYGRPSSIPPDNQQK